jgi:hypothetical protein
VALLKAPARFVMPRYLANLRGCPDLLTGKQNPVQFLLARARFV